MKVDHIQRKQCPERFSLEGYFDRVRTSLADASDVSVSVLFLPFFSRGIWRRIRNLLSARRHQADVNHVTGDIHYVALFMKRRKTLLTVPDCEILHRLQGWKRAVVKCLWYTLPARRVAAITVISEETKRQLLREIRFPPHKIHVVPVSISHLFQPSPRAFNDACPRILQIGTKSNKNIVRLAQALNGIHCHLDIVGPLDESQRAALDQSEIQFENFLQLTDEQIVERYCEADIVSFVSTYEGFGMPIVEAQNVERVCVTSNCSSMPEVAGKGACLVDPFSIESIADGFNRIISDRVYRESLIHNGRENRLRFDPDRIADQFLSLYRKIYTNAL